MTRAHAHALTRVLAIALLLGATTLALVSLALAQRAATSPRAGGSATIDDAGAGDPRALARRAVAADPAIAEPAIAALRALGPAGHAALLAEHDAAVTALRAAPPLTADAATERLRHAIDVVSGQRDGHASGLYWHTDLDAALAEARRTGRPVLSLRLLGRLDEELSCANSRFFRVVLYANEGVARELASHYVLHWQSERPAPRITIDFGDGRTLERTITGNSVHFVLDPSGRPIDALPGLYAPEQFLAVLAAARALATECGPERDPVAFDACVRRGHAAALARLEADYEARRARVAALPEWDVVAAVSAPSSPRPMAPGAAEAMPLTMAKSMIETPMLRAITRDPSSAVRLSPVPWEAGAVPDVVIARLDARSLALLRLKTGEATPGALASRLASLAAVDGFRNEVTMHGVVHSWLASERGPRDLAGLAARVYRELFLTPSTDPWLGLRSDDLWDAIEVRR